MWRADLIAHHMLCPVSFHSCRSSSSSQQSDRLEHWSSCWGEGGALWRPCNFTSIHILTGPVGQPFASCPSWGSTNSQWNWVSPVSAVLLQVHQLISSSIKTGTHTYEVVIVLRNYILRERPIFVLPSFDTRSDGEQWVTNNSNLTSEG
jgi:hypothetical protein